MPTNLAGALQSGFTMGRQAAGAGRMSSISTALKGIAENLKETRVAEQEILGKVKVKQMLQPEMPTPGAEEQLTTRYGTEGVSYTVSPKSRQKIALQSLAQNKPMPGLTLEETKKIAVGGINIGSLSSRAFEAIGEPKKETSGQYNIGQIISRGGKRYKIVDFDTDGDPLVEPVK